jgi:hypothetical protein
MSLAPDGDAISITLLVPWLFWARKNVRLMCYTELPRWVSPEEIGSRATLIGNDSVITRAFKR